MSKTVKYGDSNFLNRPSWSTANSRSLKYWSIVTIVSVGTAGALHLSNQHSAVAVTNDKTMSNSSISTEIQSPSPSTSTVSSAPNGDSNATTDTTSQSAQTNQPPASVGINSTMDSSVTMNGETYAAPTDGSTITKTVTSPDGHSNTIISISGSQSTSGSDQSNSYTRIRSNVHSSSVIQEGDKTTVTAIP